MLEREIIDKTKTYKSERKARARKEKVKREYIGGCLRGFQRRRRA
jgi:hypothetical protein